MQSVVDMNTAGGEQSTLPSGCLALQDRRSGREGIAKVTAGLLAYYVENKQTNKKEAFAVLYLEW